MNNILDALRAQLAVLLGNTPAVIVTGGQWGDEGKGKVIDLLSFLFAIVIRFSGGCNAGHTVYTEDGVKVVSHMIPCGIDKENYIGAGVFYDLDRFCGEFDETTKILGRKPVVYIDKLCPVWTEWHGLLEQWSELCRGKDRIGTTGRAIAIIAAIRAMRCGIHVGDLVGSKKELLKQLTLLYNTWLPNLIALQSCMEFLTEKGPDESEEEFYKRLKLLEFPSPIKVRNRLLKNVDRIRPMVCDTRHKINEAVKRGQKVLGEGAQATLLDGRWGTIPYVSSGDSVSAGAEINTGVTVFRKAIRTKVFKALPTRVGEGPFPGEIWDRKKAELFPKLRPELFVEGEAKQKFLSAMLVRINNGTASEAQRSQYFQVLGWELGATTRRGRSVGDFNLPLMYYSIQLDQADYACLTRLDMLSGLKKIPVIVGYKFQGKLLPYGQLPYPRDLDKVETIIEYWDGWDESILGCSRWEDLPENARKFILKVQSLIGVPFLMLGTGPDRDHAVIGPFA